jgi:hypothetical protein
MLKNMLHNLNYRNLPADSLCIPLSKQDGTEKRYFAVINKKGEIGMVFFQDKTIKFIYFDYFQQ